MNHPLNTPYQVSQAAFNDALVKSALQLYGATITPEGYIAKDGKLYGVRVVVAKRRIRFEGAISLLASGPIKAETVAQFVEKFWFWRAA
jgi:hypothetical protein